MVIAISSCMERLPTRVRHSRATPSWRSATIQRRSPPRCSRWPSIVTKSSLMIPPKIYAQWLHAGAQQLTPLELADFTSGMPDDPTNLPRELERRSIDYYTIKDFL